LSPADRALHDAISWDSQKYNRHRKLSPLLSEHGTTRFPRQTLARWVIQCSEHLQPLLNLMRDRLLESRVIHCDEMRVQVLKEPDRKPTNQSWM